jgi:phosphopantetheinyl transferase/acyl-CoA thioesterase FadM
MGGLDTWDVVRPEMTSKRFITGIKSYEPGRELTARVQLSRATDVYLDDHNYNGSLLFPTVFGLEAMAQASCYLARIPQPAGITIENISLRRPVVVPFEGDMEIGISARVMEPDPNNENRVRIFAGISTEDSDFKVFHFSAEFTIHGKPEKIIKSVNLPDKFLTINPQTDLYSWLLFQGPRFQNIDKIYTLDHGKAEFKTVKTRRDPENDCFAGEFRSPLIIGNPLLRDVLLQSVQLYLTKKKYLPVFIKRWDIFDIQKQGDGGVVLSNLSEISEDRAVCNVELVSGDQVIERISGYEVKALESTPDYPDPKTLADLQAVYSQAAALEFSRYEPFLDRRIYYTLHKQDADFNKINSKTRHEIEQGVFQSMIKEIQGIDQSCNIIWAANGKPSTANSNLKLSVSHSKSALFITAGEEEQGCDIEFVCNRTRREWEDLLENKFTAVLEQLRIIEKNDDLSCTRIWCVREALIKSFGMVPMNITIEKVIHSGIIFKALTAQGENKMVLTFPVELLPENTAILSAVVSLKKEDPSPEKSSSSEKFQAATSFNRENNAFSDTFFTTFRDCRGFYGKTHFTSFVDWMGALRELVLAPIGTELLKDLSSGQFGMVTNTSEIEIRHEAGALDEITGNLWITNQSDLQNSLIDLNFSFSKNTGDKKKILAECRLSTTWVSIEGRGVVKKSAIPDYFMKFLTEHICTTENKKGIFSRNGYPVSSDLGRIIYHSNNQLRPVVKIREKEFSTGMTHGNTVGNLYYSNYYLWQSRMIEDYLYQHEPGIMTNGGKSGEFLTLHSAVNHLQEAMPFEAVLVTMYIQEYYENGLKFYFEYHCLNDKTMRKLAYGTNTVAFCSRLNELSAPLVQSLPGSLANEVVKVVS